MGGDRDLLVDVRIVCATNKDLQGAMARREFREDLFFRISTVGLEIPPLKDRREDIVPLARRFARQLSNGARKLSSAAEGHLAGHSWPGNIRELRSCIEQAVIFAAGGEIQADELPLGRASEGVSLSSDLLLDAERRHILDVLRKVNGNKTEAAKVLGIARSTLVMKLKSYGLG